MSRPRSRRAKVATAVAVGFALGAAGAFVAGLLRKRALVPQTGYQPPAPSDDRQAVTEPDPVHP